MNKPSRVKYLLLFLLFVTFLFGKIQGGFVSWFLFYSTLILYGYIWVVIRYSLQDIKITRTFKETRLHTDETVEVEIIFVNYSSFPLSYLLIRDFLPDKFESDSKKVERMIFPWFRSKSFVRYEIPNAIRGVHRFRQVEILTGDVFGLVKISRTIPVYGEIVVYPKSYPIDGWDSRNHRNVGHIYSENRSSEDAGAVVGIREYRIGDRFNRIHWKQSAKTMQWMTKEFERFSTNDFMFFIDQERIRYGNQSDQFEALIELTASLIHYASTQRFSFGMVFEGKGRVTVPLGRGEEQLRRSYEALAMLEAESTIPFENTVLDVIHFLPMGTTIILLVPSVRNSLRHLIAELTIRKYKVELFVLSSNNLSDEEVQLQQRIGVIIHHLSITEWRQEGDTSLKFIN